MKSFYLFLLNIFCILSCNAQQKLQFRFNESPITYKNGLNGKFIINKNLINNNAVIIDEKTIAECDFYPAINRLDSREGCPGLTAILSTQALSGYTYKWLLDDKIIPNANASVYTAYQSGKYVVIVHDMNCNVESLPFSIILRAATMFNPLQDTLKQCGANVLLDAGTDFSEYNWNTGQTTQSINVNATGNYIVSTIDSNGCLLKDSCFVSVINEQIHQTDSSVCSGSQIDLYVTENNGNSTQALTFTWLNGGTTNPLSVFPNQSTNYIVNVSNGYGVCTDSIYVHVNLPSSSTQQINACGSYLWNGTDYTQSGEYNFTTTNSTGCDSLLTLYLIINHPTSSIYYYTACDSYTWHSQTYISSGIYEYTTTNEYGCDNIEQLNLTINRFSESFDTVSSCVSYLWNNQTYTISGNYTYATSNLYGCDSIATLILTITNSTSSITNITAIDSYSWNGQIYYSSGTYVFMSSNANGCDSIALLVLDLNTPPDCTITASSTAICDGQTVILATAEIYAQKQTGTNRNGIVLSNISRLTYLWSDGETTSTINVSPAVTTTYTVTISDGITSCTNSITIFVNHTTSSTEVISTCGNYTWNGTDYYQSGSYIFTTTNSVGCDSIATLNLVIETTSIVPDSIVSTANSINTGESVILNVSGGTLGDGAVWNWYTDSCGGTLIGSGTQITIAPIVNTTYFVHAEGTCGITECVSTTIAVNACGPVLITSNANDNTICKGNSISLTVQGMPGVGGSWAWYKNGCSLGCVIGTGTSILVSPTTTTTYYVLSVGGQCGTTNCLSITINVNNAPHNPSAIIGPAVVLCNGPTITYTVIPVIGATSYTWTVPNGAMIVSGQGTPSIAVNFAAVSNHNGSCNNNSICVKANNNCGSSCITCMPVSTSLQGSISISGPSSVTRNQIVTYSTFLLNGASVYTWVLPAGWVLLSGQGTNLIHVRAGSQSGNVKVTPSNLCGYGFAAYKYVRVSNSNGSCSEYEEEKTAQNSSTNFNSGINIWPNPVSDYLNIDAGSDQPIKIELIDIQGKIVFISTFRNRFSVNKLASGIYFLRIYTNEGLQTKRLQVVR